MLRIVFLFLVGLMTSCYYDKEEVLYPDSANCTLPVTLSFSANIMPILNGRCNNCHSGVAPSAGISLSNHTDVMKYVNNGTLIGSITWASGFSPMPKNSGKMPACEIQKIQTWIDQGALNN